MSIVRSLRRPKTEERSTVPWHLLPQLIASQGGYTVASTTETALRNAASWACINVLADTISRTPWDVVKTRGKTRTPVDPTPSIVGDPSILSEPDVWRTQLAVSIVTDGNVYGQILDTVGGHPAKMEILDPGCVSPNVVNGRKVFIVDGVEQRAYADGGVIWHVPGKTVLPGSPFGLSPLKYASKVLGLSLAAEDFSNRFFTDGGHPTWGLALETDPGPEAIVAMKAAFVNALKPGTREPFVHAAGAKPVQFSVQPGETQFIDLMQHCCLEAARFWGVPPSMIFAAVSGQNVTYANVTDADLAFLKHSVDGLFGRLETGWSRLLPDGQTVKANRSAILRGDVKARHEVYGMRLQQGTITVDEIRTLEDEPPMGVVDETSASARDVAEAIQKIYLGVVNNVLTSDEAREIVNRLGADLPVPGPPELSEKPDKPDPFAGPEPKVEDVSPVQ